MAITNQHYASAIGSPPVMLTIAQGAGNNRMVIALATQAKGDGANISSITLNGVAGTLVGQTGTSGDQFRAIAAFWFDSSLPSAAGDYVVQVNGNTESRALSAFSAGGVKQSAPVDVRTAVGEASSRNFALTAVTGSVAFMATNWNWGGSQTIALGAGQTAMVASTAVSSGIHAHSFDAADTSISHTYTGLEHGAALAFAIEPAASDDATKPVLSGASASPASPVTATCSVTTDEGNGTLYGVVTASATPPTPAQVREGVDHAGAPAAWSSNQSLSSAGLKTFSATGLAASTSYCFHATQRDIAGNEADVASSSAFTQPAEPSVAVNGNNVLDEGDAIALESVGIVLTGASALYLRHNTLKVPQADLAVIDADSATASYVGAVADIGVPFTTAKHTVSVGITVGGNDHEAVIDHRPLSGRVYTQNPATMVAGDGSLFKAQLAWFTTQSLAPSSDDQCVLPDQVSGGAISWLLDSSGNFTGYVEQGPQAGTGTARYWLAGNRTWYDIGFTLVEGQIDTIAPSVVAGPTLSNVTQTTAILAATVNENGVYGIAVQGSAAIAPNAGDILAGTVSGAAWSLSAMAMIANAQFQVSLNGLVAGLSYRAHIALRDAAGNTRVVTSNPWTMQSTDTTAPDLMGGISITGISQTTATLSATANESGEYGIAVLPAPAATPIGSAILGGAVTGAAWSRGATALGAGVPISAVLIGLTPGSQYRAHMALRDAPGNTRVVSSNPFTQQPSTTDTTAPQFSAGPGVANLQPTGFDITFTADEAGQYRIVLLPLGAEQPSVVEVFNGTGKNGATPVAASALLSMSAHGATSTPFSGLAAATAYLPYVAVRDTVNNARLGWVGAVTTPAIPDVSAPTIHINTVALGGNQVVTASVADNVGVVGVLFRINGQAVGAELTSPPWQWVWHTGGYPQGNYSIDAVARDGAGNTTLSNSVLVQLSAAGQPDGAPLVRQGKRTYVQRDERWFEVEAAGND